MNAVETMAQDDKVVSGVESRAARKAGPGKEKELQRLCDEPGEQRRGFPWTGVEKNYLSDGTKEKETLADLSDELSQLIVYQFMCDPGWEAARAARSTPIILTAPWLI